MKTIKKISSRLCRISCQQIYEYIQFLLKNTFQRHVWSLPYGIFDKPSWRAEVLVPITRIIYSFFYSQRSIRFYNISAVHNLQLSKNSITSKIVTSWRKLETTYVILHRTVVHSCIKKCLYYICVNSVLSSDNNSIVYVPISDNSKWTLAGIMSIFYWIINE